MVFGYVMVGSLLPQVPLCSPAEGIFDFSIIMTPGRSSPTVVIEVLAHIGVSAQIGVLAQGCEKNDFHIM